MPLPAGSPTTACRPRSAAFATTASRRFSWDRNTPAAPISASWGRRRDMRVRVLAHALVVGALLVIALDPPVEAQRGLGRGRGRQPEPAPPKEQTKDPQTNKDQQTPKE